MFILNLCQHFCEPYRFTLGRVFLSAVRAFVDVFEPSVWLTGSREPKEIKVKFLPWQQYF